jgi:hypothetical protein
LHCLSSPILPDTEGRADFPGVGRLWTVDNLQPVVLLSVELQRVKGARSRWLALAFVVAVCAGGGAVALGLASGGDAGASAQTGAITTASPATFRAGLIAHLRAEHLDYHWVVCVRTPHVFHGVPVVRCNVDFGEPHIQAYCSVLRGGRLLTNYQDPAIPCGHDNSGFSDPVVQYG